MKKLAIMLATIAAMAAAPDAEAQQGPQGPQGPQDWANYGRYAEANAQLRADGVKPRVVFMGDSITDGWPGAMSGFFADNGYAGRGISGQVTAQMLARFRADVIDLGPRVVVILAGTNDIAGNQGPVSIENIAGNIYSMAQIALAGDIVPVICSVLPAAGYPWRPAITGVADKVRELNARLKGWAEENGVAWVDYWSAMADERGGLPPELAADGIHPTAAGYERMAEIVKPALDALLK